MKKGSSLYLAHLLFDRPRCEGEGHDMPRQLRMQYPGAMCHVMSRGNRRQDISRQQACGVPGQRSLGIGEGTRNVEA
jgi:hypothetical protein